MPKLLRICLISVLALVYNKLSNAIYCRCGPTRSPRADFRATLQHLSASANQPHTYLATQHPHPHGRTRSRQFCVDSPTMLLRISRKTTVAPGFFPFTDDAGEPRCSGSRKYPEMQVQVMVTASALCLLTAAGAASAQDAQQTPSVQMNQSAKQQGAAPTPEQVRDTSVGGMSMSRTQTGGRTLYGAPCRAGTFCDIYHGN
jgi:hypothetical protein